MASERTYKLAAIKMVTPSKEHLEEHYKDLSDKPFFKGLVTYMLSGPIVAMVWEGRDAVKTGRTLLGATNPLQSAPGTIRGDYAIDVGRNVCHGSDSVETAKNEIDLWFGKGEVIEYKNAQFDWIYEKPLRAERKQVASVDASQASTHGTSTREPFQISSDSCGHLSRPRTVDPAVILQIENVVGQIVDGLQKQEDGISISLRTKKVPKPSSTQTVGRSSKDYYKISFPGRSSQEARRFSRAAFTEALYKDRHDEKHWGDDGRYRNIYYKDPELFQSQKVVDRYVDILAYTFGLRRAALNVVSLPFVTFLVSSPCAYTHVETAAAKGLIAGTYHLTFHDGSSSSSGGLKEVCVTSLLIEATPIDNWVNDVRSIDISGMSWILVIEKEAKGYPDVSTRTLLRLLSLSSHPPPRIYALVDFDPDGIAIMSTYKHGSFTLSHENANLRAPSMRWLGVKSGDFVVNDPDGGSDDSEQTGLLTLSNQDRKKAIKILGRELCNEDGLEHEWRRELQVMLMLNIKVEMEILSERRGGLEHWVGARLCERASRSVSKRSDF
ncbi:MAG: hypothetical protein Q9210_005122 [Variospora velana]